MAIIKYTYKDPKEMSAFRVINEGDGYFKILEFESKVSKAGNQMLVMTCKLRDEAGNETLYLHHILNNEWLGENIWRICESIGHPELYKEGGTNTEDLLGCAGKCKIKTERNDFGESSKIYRFLPYKSIRQETLEQPTVEIEDDSLPF